MKRLAIPLMAAVFLVPGFLIALPRIEIHLQLRLYQALPAEGAAVFIRWETKKEDAERPAYFYTGSAESPDPRPEEAEIKKIFKVRDLQIVAENAVKIAFVPHRMESPSRSYLMGYWEGHYGVRGPLLETVLSDGQTYALRIIPLDALSFKDRGDARRFKIQIYEPTLKTVIKDSSVFTAPTHFYVDVDFTLPFGHTTIIGFADTKDTPYFLSVQLENIIGEFETLEFIQRTSRSARQTESLTESTALQPEFIKKAEPVYPPSCRDEGIEGAVWIEVSVDAKGRPERVKVIRGVHPELDKAAVEAVEKWVFKPRLVEGRPAPAVYNLAVEFRIRESPAGL